MRFCLLVFVLILFVMMRNKDNSFISFYSPSTSGSSWILARCVLFIMKTIFGYGGIFVIHSLTIDRHGVSRSLLHTFSSYFLCFPSITATYVGPLPRFGIFLVMLNYFGLRQPVEGGSQHEAEIAGSRPLFGSFLGFGNM
jgi:hypothetical protein